ncbi:hypothetical protein AN958_07195 [Leucoagaricus sp. SymC.cos]|nr:hypothetical protein AN958_07195 [Leucoagaricus sp. SymC.cos]
MAPFLVAHPPPNRLRDLTQTVSPKHIVPPSLLRSTREVGLMDPCLQWPSHALRSRRRLLCKFPFPPIPNRPSD